MPVRRWPGPASKTAEPAVWLDFTTSQGVDDSGHAVEPPEHATDGAGVWQMLETALAAEATKIMVSGKVPSRPSWLLAERDQPQDEFTPGWTVGEKGHWLGDFPQGRFIHTPTNREVNILLVEQWFPGHGTMTPAAALYCHRLLTQLVADGLRRSGWVLSRLPGNAFAEIWRRVAPWQDDLAGQGSSKRPPHYEMDHVEDELGQLIQNNDPQHRIELYTQEGRCGCDDCIPLHEGDTAPMLAYADGRFMYQGVIHDTIGAAPLKLITGPEATELFTSSKGWAPARYRIRYTVPEVWAQSPGGVGAGESTTHLGLFPCKLQTSDEEWRWHWPNRPGSTHEAWADAAELRLARQWWPDGAVEILEGIAYTEVNSLGHVANLFGQLENAVAELKVSAQGRQVDASDQLKGVMRAAVRNLLLVGIGSLSRRWWSRSVTVDSPAKVPPGRAFERNDSGTFTYEEPTSKSAWDRDTWHPEIAARVWGAARAEVLQTRQARKHGVGHYGALAVPAHELIAIQGDAIYTITPQVWTFPVEAGGGDDGSNGRIRIKGVAEPGDVTEPEQADGGDQIRLPRTRTELNRLSSQAEESDWQTVWRWD